MIKIYIKLFYIIRYMSFWENIKVYLQKIKNKLNEFCFGIVYKISFYFLNVKYIYIGSTINYEERMRVHKHII